MNSLTVEDLLLLGHSTTSSIEQVGLIGRLSIVPDDKTCGNRMGTILFTDLDGQYSLPCNVDIMRKEILHCQVMITCWNYISCSETDVSYLEFSLKHVYRIDDTTVSLLEECLQLDDQKFTDSLICNPSLITPDQLLQTATIGESVHVLGKVTAISRLYNQPDCPATFFIQLAPEEDLSASITIFFKEVSLVEYYPMFRIGCFYAFQHIHSTPASSILDTLEQNVPVFIYDSIMSSVQMISIYHYRTYTPTRPSMIHSEALDGTISIDCQIKRVIDVSLGIYEIENGEIICLLNTAKYDRARPFRVSTLLRLDHVHRIHVQSEDGANSCLFQHLWEIGLRPSYSVIVACYKSHVQVNCFPDHCELMQTTRWSFSANELLYMNTPRLLHVMEIFAFLKMELKIVLEPFKLACSLEHLLFRSAESAYENHIVKFLRHDTGCTILDDVYNTKESLNNYTICLRSFSTLSSILPRLQASAKESSPLSGIGSAGGSNFLPVPLFTAEFNEHSFGYGVLGLILAAYDGELYFMGDNHQMPILISNQAEEWIQEGLYLLKRVRYIKEDMLYSNINGNSSVTFEQLICANDDIFLVETYGHAQLTFFCRPLISSHGISRFSVPNELHQQQLSDSVYHVIYILRIYSTKLTQTNSWLESSIDCDAYTLNHTSVNKRHYMLRLSSRKGSLKYKPRLKPGRWYILRGPLKRYSQELDAQEHAFYPIHIQVEDGLGPSSCIKLYYSEIATETPRLSNVIHNISELVNVQVGSSNRISVKGIIVDKSFQIERDTGLTGIENAAAMFGKFKVGTGVSKRKLYVRLRQPYTLETLGIYLDLDRVRYPLGLIPDAYVIIKHVKLKKISDLGEKMFCKADEHSTVEIVNINSLHEPSVTSPYKTTTSLSCFISGECNDHMRGVHRILCSITNIVKFYTTARCARCRSVYKENKCTNCHTDPGYVLLASAEVNISDGTIPGTVYVEGERLVFRMLQLNQESQECFKQYVAKHGMISYTSSSDQKELQSIFYNAKKGSIFIYCEHMSEARTVQGSLERPKPKLRALEIEPVDYAAVAWDILNT
ncbi:hypothetical protein RMATCC62417_05153 [Rhizopus microsporus]|nr:hypothetical protein RMATCC62417_05153 [Rhizopus microsporus]